MGKISCFGCGADQENEGFLHGVGSFDPLPNAVLLWTRITPANAPPSRKITVETQQQQPPSFSLANGSAPVQEIPVHFEVSTGSRFRQEEIVKRGTFVTNSDRDWTVCVDVEGLKPCTRYYYQFFADGGAGGRLVSPIGETKTAPAAGQDVESMTFALVSCANWEFGHFHVFDMINKLDDVDLIVHAGDYVYQDYGSASMPGKKYPQKHQRARKGLMPKWRCDSLGDFRTRYACYRTDAALQELHRRYAMVAVWDDHEVADGAWREGAFGDNEYGPEEYQRRKMDGIRAFAEWVPIRGLDPKQPRFLAACRTLQFGDLFTVSFADNRFHARDKPMNISETSFYKEVAKKSKHDWNDERILDARRDLKAKLKDPERKMLGEEQVEKLRNDVHDAVRARIPWQFFISPTVFGRLTAPRLLETVDLQPAIVRGIGQNVVKLGSSSAIAGENAELARMYIGMGKYKVEMNPMAWDGYQAERSRVMDALGQPGANAIVLSGDSHNAWASNLVSDDGKRVGVEFAGPAVTSAGAFEEIHAQFEGKTFGLANCFPLFCFSPWIMDALKVANPELQYSNIMDRGCVVLQVDRQRVHAEYHYVSAVSRRWYSTFCGAAFEIGVGERQMHSVARKLTIGGKIPKRKMKRRLAVLTGMHDVSDSIYRRG